VSKPLKTLLFRWLPLFLWAVIIFILSNEPNPYSHIPGRLYSWLWWTKLFRQSLIFYLGGISHVLEYTILSYLLARALLWRGEYNRGQLFKVIFLTLLYAFTDEFHQSFIPGRAFQLIDLVLDTLGSFFGTAIYLLYLKRAEINQSRFMQVLRSLPSRCKKWKINRT